MEMPICVKRRTSSETQGLFSALFILLLGARALRSVWRNGLYREKRHSTIKNGVDRKAGRNLLPAFVCFFGAFFPQGKKAEYLKLYKKAQ